MRREQDERAVGEAVDGAPAGMPQAFAHRHGQRGRKEQFQCEGSGADADGVGGVHERDDLVDQPDDAVRHGREDLGAAVHDPERQPEQGNRSVGCLQGRVPHPGAGPPVANGEPEHECAPQQEPRREAHRRGHRVNGLGEHARTSEYAGGHRFTGPRDKNPLDIGYARARCPLQRSLARTNTYVGDAGSPDGNRNCRDGRSVNVGSSGRQGCGRAYSRH